MLSLIIWNLIVVSGFGIIQIEMTNFINDKNINFIFYIVIKILRVLVEIMFDLDVGDNKIYLTWCKCCQWWNHKHDKRKERRSKENYYCKRLDFCDFSPE